MNKKFEIPDRNVIITEELKELFKDDAIWVQYVMFTHSNIAEVKFGDPISYERGMEKLKTVSTAGVASFTGVDKSHTLLVLFKKR